MKFTQDKFFLVSPYKGKLDLTNNDRNRFRKTVRTNTKRIDLLKKLNHTGVPSHQKTFHSNLYPKVPILSLKNYKPFWSKRINRLKTKAASENPKYTFYDWHKFTNTYLQRKSSINSTTQQYLNITSKEMIKEIEKSSKEADELRNFMITRKLFFKNEKRSQCTNNLELKRMNKNFYYRERVYDQDLEELLAK